MAVIAFSGGLSPDVDAAAVALRKAGFEVLRMPSEYHKRMDVPGDECVEAYKMHDENHDEDDALHAMFEEVNALVDQYGGLAHECGVVEQGHVPFAFFR
jgi:hypothetical protein